jgi:hypothetical protein
MERIPPHRRRRFIARTADLSARIAHRRFIGQNRAPPIYRPESRTADLSARIAHLPFLGQKPTPPMMYLHDQNWQSLSSQHPPRHVILSAAKDDIGQAYRSRVLKIIIGQHH